MPAPLSELPPHCGGRTTIHSKWSLIPQLCCTRARRLAGWSARWAAAAQHGQSHRANRSRARPEQEEVRCRVCADRRRSGTYRIAMPVSLTGRLWAKRVVEASPEAYDAVVLHAGSWDATYTAYNASGFEDGRRAEVSTWRGATGLSEGPSHCQPVLQPPRVSSICHDGGVVYGPWQPQTAGPAPEARPSLNRRACLPYGGLPSCRAPTAFLSPDHDATLPRPKLLPQP